jgi:hypothetical protein
MIHLDRGHDEQVICAPDSRRRRLADAREVALQASKWVQASRPSLSPSRRQATPKRTDPLGSLGPMIDQLIKENRALRRELGKALAGGAVTPRDVENALRAIQRRVQRALDRASSPQGQSVRRAAKRAGDTVRRSRRGVSR